MSSSKLSIKSVPHGTILFARLVSYAKLTPPKHFSKFMLELQNVGHLKGNVSRMTNVYITRSHGVTGGHERSK